MPVLSPGSPEKERRRWPRFATKEGCLIFEADGAVGEVQDISAGGLCVSTIYDLPEKPCAGKNGILCCSDFLVENIEFQVITDTVLPKAYEFSTIVKKRYGIRFTNLTAIQQQRLRQIIKICRTS